MFPHKPIKKMYTLWGYAGTAIWIFIALAVLYNWLLDGRVVSLPLWADLLILFSSPIIIVLAMYQHRRDRLRDHRSALKLYAEKKKYRHFTGFKIQDGNFSKMSLVALKNTRNDHIHDVIRGPEWLYAEYSYDVVRKWLGMTYKVATVYYSVMATSLPRALPNVFFASKEAGGRQFTMRFAEEENHAMHEDFDQSFDTYYPEQFTRKSMSFVTQDVMVALANATDYDIEIVGDRLFLYGPIHKPSQLLPDMEANILTIRSFIRASLPKYHPGHLPHLHGGQRVAPLDASLTRSRFWAYISLIGLIIFAAFFIADKWPE